MESLPQPVRAVLVAAPDAPPAAEIAAALAREGIDVVLAPGRDGAVAAAAGEEPPPPTGQASAPIGVADDVDRPVALVWLPADPDADALADALRALSPRLVLGCAPQAQPPVGERALAAGFDDFVAGRAPARELAARLRALARCAARDRGRPRDLLTHGRIALDGARHELWIDDRRVSLTTLEVAILSTLILARGRALSRAELLDRVWGTDELEVGPRAVDNLVLRLRRKIGDDLIVTVRGLGFRV